MGEGVQNPPPKQQKKQTFFFLPLKKISKSCNTSYINKDLEVPRRIGICPGSSKNSTKRKIWTSVGQWWEGRYQRASLG